VTLAALALAASLLASPGPADDHSGPARGEPRAAGASTRAGAKGGRAKKPGTAGAATADTPEHQYGGARKPQPAAGPPHPDQEIIDHLDEIENLELLENLELFDPKAGDEGERKR